MKDAQNAAAPLAFKPTASVPLLLFIPPSGIRVAAKPRGRGDAAGAAPRAGFGDASEAAAGRLKASAALRGPAAMRRKGICGTAGKEAA